jgi:hypothetical protein
MKVLIGILDGLVHFRPEWSDEQGKHFKLSKLLISEKIPLDPALPNPIDAFPLACMYADTADWATSTADSFIREIRTRLGGVHRPL